MTKMINSQSFENGTVEVTIRGETRRLAAYKANGAIVTRKGQLRAMHAGVARGVIVGVLADGSERVQVENKRAGAVYITFA